MQYVGHLDDGMTGKTIHELLDLPEHVTSPHAYQVFGLKPGEPNAAAIHEAIAQRINQLKAAKPSTAPETWSLAAQVVQTAQRTLTDPKKKAKLDARFGIVAMDDSASRETASSNQATAAAPVTDPLAALLPTSKPATAQPATNQPAPTPVASAPTPVVEPVTAEVVEASVAGGPVVDHVSVTPSASPVQGIGNVAPTPNPAVSASAAPLVVQPRSPSADRARRRQKSGGWLMGGFLLLGFVIVGFLAAFFFWGPGEVQVVRSNDGITIRTKTDNANRPEQSAPPAIDRGDSIPPKKPTSDGIMKRPPAGQPDSRDSLGNFLSNPGSMPDTSAMPVATPGMSSMPETRPGPGMETPTATGNNMQPSGMQPNGMQPAAGTPQTGPSQSDPSPAMETKPAARPEATPENIEAGETAIAAAENAIRQADWAKMKPLAEAAEKAAANNEQATRAETIYQIADLGTYYRGGVSRAMADLGAGNEFRVTDAISLLVVEASAEQLIARRGARNYTYPLDEVPFVVSKALAEFQLPMESETGQAAQAVYESIATKSTPDVREDAVGILRSLQNVEGADAIRMADWLETRYTPTTSQ
ncbi:hypothetical protein [Rhodopirellula bahusiensis]|uniref:hypothetical protein n=3 Tax=Rhodopirellula bahusiensis TaxID=2014065 RepID=UPI003298A90E